MTEYEKSIVEAGAKVAFPPEIVKIPLGRVISEAGYKQLRVQKAKRKDLLLFILTASRKLRLGRR